MTTVDLLDHAIATDTEALTWARVLTPTDGERDAMRLILNGITTRIEAFRGGHVVAADRAVTERLDGNGKPYIHLRQFPAVSVTSITALNPVDESVVTSYTVTSATHRVTDTGKLWIVDQDWFPVGRENIKVVYVPGWEEPPADLRLAVLQWAADWFKTWQKDREPIQSVSLNGQTTTFFSEEIPKKVKAVLEMYRLPWSGVSA